MYTAVTILIILVCILLVLIVLIQNPKGGGISSGIIGSNQVMGVKKTSDFIEKLTWGLAIGLVVLCMLAGMALPNKQDRSVGSSMQEQIDNSGAAAPTAAPAAKPAAQPAQSQPATTQPAQPAEQPQTK